MSVALTVIKASEIVKKNDNHFKAALHEALSTMDERERMMRLLDTGMSSLGLLINVSNSAAAVSHFFDCSDTTVTLVVV